MKAANKVHLGAKEIRLFASDYLNGGRKKESWEISHIDIEGKILTAQVRMGSRYISPTDENGFHLTIFSTLEFLSQLTIIYAHAWAGYTEKTREGWMIESAITSKYAIRDPENIQVRMEALSIKKWKHNIIATTKSHVTDGKGSFNATLKGFLS